MSSSSSKPRAWRSMTTSECRFASDKMGPNMLAPAHIAACPTPVRPQAHPYQPTLRAGKLITQNTQRTFLGSAYVPIWAGRQSAAVSDFRSQGSP